MSTVIFPYAYIPDPTKGKPISNGQLFFGLPDLDPEIEVLVVYLYTMARL